MTLRVSTARVGHTSPDALDITAKSAREGLFLAPSWAILRPTLARLKDAAEVLARGMAGRTTSDSTAIAEAWAAEAWAWYEPRYIAEMRGSYKTRRPEWNALLARGRVVLCCFCVLPASGPGAERCHRRILAAKILTALGAIDEGEVRP